MINDGRRDCVHGFRWCAQCCWSGGRSTKEFLAGVASPPPGTAPGDQGGEPRRPQAGDSVEHSLLGRPEPIEVTAIDLHAFRAVGTDGSRWTIPYKSPHWRWPATRGAAVAGPVCVECGDRGGRWDEEAIDQWYPCRTCETDEPAPLPPASEPPRSYSPSCAGTCWPPCAHHGVEVALFMYKDRTRVLVQLAEVTAAKAALEAARDNAVRERDEARDARTRALALATEHLEAKAALEVQLAEALTLVAPFGGGDLLVGIRHLQRSLDREIEEHQRHHNNEDALRAELAAERAAHEGAQRELVAAIEHHGHHLATLSEAFGDWPQGDWTILEGWVKAIRGMREALIAAAKALRAGATCAQDDGRPFTAIALSDAAARAALAASGPVKEGT